MRPRISTFGLILLFGGLISASLYGIAWSQPGTVQSFSKITDLTLPGSPLDDADEFGDAVAGLGDLDGAGPSVAALAVGAIGDDDGGSHHGAVYILFLNAAGSVISYQQISSTQGGFTGTLASGDEFGGSLVSLGDLDGPGPSVCALAVGAIGDAGGGSARGAVYVLFLNAAGGVISHQKINASTGGFTGPLDDGDEFGGAVANLGDLDGAGPAAGTMVVGAIYDDDGGANRGAAYILFLNSNGTVRSQRKINSLTTGFTTALGDNDNFGEDMASLGDLDRNGPSVATLAITAVDDDDGCNDCGAAYLFFLNSDGTFSSFQKISKTAGGFNGPLLAADNFGTGIVALGDLDGTGPSAAAIACAAGSDDGAGLNRGAIYILFLNTSGSCLSYQEISSTAGGSIGSQLHDDDEFGSSVAALGDIDGTGGAGQVLVAGVGYDSDGGPMRGAAYLMNLAGGTVVGVDDAPAAGWSGLRNARPNPFLGGTNVSFQTATAGHVRIDVWDTNGRHVRRLLDRHSSPGEHQVTWDGADDSGRARAPGAYYLRMSVDGVTVTNGVKAVLLR
jgi:FlgD Ig-like domain/FG-GAP repeat